MKLIKRVKADIRGPNRMESEIESTVNGELVELQKAGAQIIDVKEISKDSGAVVFIILYDGKVE